MRHRQHLLYNLRPERMYKHESLSVFYTRQDRVRTLWCTRKRLSGISQWGMNWWGLPLWAGKACVVIIRGGKKRMKMSSCVYNPESWGKERFIYWFKKGIYFKDDSNKCESLLLSLGSIPKVMPTIVGTFYIRFLSRNNWSHFCYQFLFFILFSTEVSVPLAWVGLSLL